MDTPITPATTALDDTLQASDDEFGYRLSAIPLGPRRITTWSDRLAVWRELRNLPLYRETARAVAGRQAEAITQRLVSVHHSTRYGHVFTNKRIPRDVTAAAMGRFEADLLVLTPRRVVVLEVKNWSGSLRVDGERWIQVRRFGEEVVHDNLLVANREKLRALQRYLLHHGVDLPASCFHQAVVFAHPSLKLDRTLVNHPAVLHFGNFQSVLGSGVGLGQRVAAKLIDWAMSAEAAASVHQHALEVIPPARLAAAADAVGQLRTWDRLTLRGGRILVGDLVWVRTGGVQVTSSSLNAEGEASVYWRTGYLDWLGWVRRGGAPGQMIGTLLCNQDKVEGRSVPLYDHDCIYFHEPGRREPSIIALSHVQRIQLG